MTDDYAKKRLAELHAAAPAKRKKTAPFAVVSLPAAAKAFAVANCPKAMLWLWLLHQTRKTGKRTVAVAERGGGQVRRQPGNQAAGVTPMGGGRIGRH
jgi:hypothetical protein